MIDIIFFYAIILFVFLRAYYVALKSALETGIKIVKNRAEIVKKQESLNLCFDLS